MRFYRARRIRKAMIWGVALIFMISALYLFSHTGSAQHMAQTSPGPSDTASWGPEFKPMPMPMPLPAARSVYPLSVIPGGVESVAELKQIMRANPEIARHLKDFDLNKARLVSIAQPRAAYVSYRIGDHIFWTTKQLTLKKGESILTDGTHIIRGRCGNDVSYVPMLPIAPGLELTPSQLDTPLLPPDEPSVALDGAFFSVYSSSLGSQGPATYATPSTIVASPLGGEPAGSALFPIFSPGGISGTESTPTPAPTASPTPEPLSALLVLTGGIMIAIWGLLSKKKGIERASTGPENL